MKIINEQWEAQPDHAAWGVWSFTRNTLVCLATEEDAKAIATLPIMARLLEQIEWSRGHCPACKAQQIYGGHLAECTWLRVAEKIGLI